MNEQIFFDNNGVKVTNARFIVDANTYSIRNITSTAAWSQSQKWGLGAILVLMGLAAIKEATGFGLFLLLVAAIVLYRGRPVHYVRLHTSGGEIKAVKSYDLEYVRQVVQALNEAIITQHKT